MALRQVCILRFLLLALGNLSFTVVAAVTADVAEEALLWTDIVVQPLLNNVSKLTWITYGIDNQEKQQC